MFMKRYLIVLLIEGLYGTNVSDHVRAGGVPRAQITDGAAGQTDIAALGRWTHVIMILYNNQYITKLGNNNTTSLFIPQGVDNSHVPGTRGIIIISLLISPLLGHNSPRHVNKIAEVFLTPKLFSNIPYIHTYIPLTLYPRRGS
jgi:hypothetical protein